MNFFKRLFSNMNEKFRFIIFYNIRRSPLFLLPKNKKYSLRIYVHLVRRVLANNYLDLKNSSSANLFFCKIHSFSMQAFQIYNFHRFYIKTNIYIPMSKKSIIIKLRLKIIMCKSIYLCTSSLHEVVAMY